MDRAAAAARRGAGGGAWLWFTRERPIEVEVAPVTERAAGTQASVLNASGYVTARRRATVSSKVTGKVVEVNVEEGMAVREGQVLARLDDSTLRAGAGAGDGAARGGARARCRENEVRLEEARLTLSRREQLLKDGLVTPADVDQAQAEVDSLDRAHRARRAAGAGRRAPGRRCSRPTLDNTVIRAPFSGVAISKDAQPGEMVSPVSAGGGFTRTGICTIVDMRSLEIEVDVNESYINRVDAGAAGHRGARRVSRLADSGARSSRPCRRPIGRRPRCWCASASRSSIRASCPTWA